MSNAALPRLFGAAILSLACVVVLAAPASSLAAPLPGSGLPLVITPSPAAFPQTTVGTQSQSLEIDLFNEGEEEAAIEKVAIEGEDPSAFNLNSNNCTTIFQNQHCQVGISFQPGSLGEKHATAFVRFVGGVRPEESFALTGTGVAPQLSFHPGSHDFGVQPTNSEAQRFNFQVENDGEAAVQLGNPEFAGGANGFWFDNNDCSGRTLQPNESCSVEVSFGPGNPGVYSTQLRINGGGEYFSAQLSGEGGRPVITATPNPADFGVATVGSDGSTEKITVSNSGNVAAGFFIAVISGGDAGSFHLIEENCSAAPLAPDSSCTAKVRFAPLSSGQRMARLSFFGEGEGGEQIALHGEGVAAAPTLAPLAYDFGSRAKGSTGPRHAFAVRNDGSAPLSLDGASIVGPSFDQFSLSGDSCAGTTLAVGQECDVSVRFSPDVAGAQAATLRIRGDGGTLSAALSGTATTSPQVSFRWPGTSQKVRGGAALSIGSASCREAKQCRLTVSAQLTITPRSARGPAQAQRRGLPTLKASFGPGKPRSLELSLPASARRLLADGSATLKVRAKWNADGKRGSAQHSLVVR